MNYPLQQLGFSEKEIDVYIRLLKIGQGRASVLAYQLGLPRTTVQNILLRLEKEGLITKTFDKNTALFVALHPDKLVEIFEHNKREQERNLQNKIDLLKKNLPDLKSLIGINKKIPNVRFFQGREAVRKVLFDTLTSKTELKDFANIDAMFAHVKDINDEYVAAREETKVTKRSLLLDTPFAHLVYDGGKYSPKSHKGYKWINSELYPFTLEMNIYDGKVSYLTYVEDGFVGVIVENEYIYQMHESIWNLIWDMLPAPKTKKRL